MEECEGGNGGGYVYTMSNEKAHVVLGYRDVVGKVEALSRTVQWLARPQNHPQANTV